MEAGGRRPSGTVVFLFTDVVGSTRLWAREPDAMSRALERHDVIVRRAIHQRRGYLFSTAGDAFAAAFTSADDAAAAAAAIQAAMGSTRWPTTTPLEVRIGLHAGVAVERNGDHFGPVLNTAARVEAAARPGQVLATRAVRELSSVPMRPLGAHHLRDIAHEIELFEIGDGAFGPFLPPGDVVSTLPPVTSRLIGRAHEVREIRRLLRRARFVTITGVGGCGKTRLAIEVGAKELTEADGVYFVDLSTVSEPAAVPSAAAAGIGLSWGAGIDPLGHVVDHLRTRSALVVSDNAEHLLDAVADLTGRLLSACPSSACW